ncbi:MAG TPA: hypothetical protein VD929_04600 [Caulobacteraceae bacterium]|nr:hypothetical protein [Caulobacteraceae bacterium]
MIRMVGWTAMAVAVAGYGGMLIALGLAAAGELTRTQALLIGGGAGVVGEIALWIAAGCLGLTIFRKRKELLRRVFGRKDAPAAN